jgi:hypothetical protein
MTGIVLNVGMRILHGIRVKRRESYLTGVMYAYILSDESTYMHT